MWWGLIFPLLVSTAVVLAAARYRKYWLAKHAADPHPPTPAIAAVSPATGALIPTGTEYVSDHGIGDGTPPELPIGGP